MTDRTLWPSGTVRRNRPNLEARIEKLRIAGEVNTAAIIELLFEKIDSLEQAVGRLVMSCENDEVLSPAGDSSKP